MAPSVRIIAKMPAMSRWLKTWMAIPARTRSATMSACRSEKAEHKIGLERQNLRNVRGDEGGNPRLLAADLRRPHRIAGDADDAVLLAEQIQRLDGLFGQADDPAGWELAHTDDMPNSGRHVTAAITSEVIA